MKKSFALYPILILAGAACASATSIPVIQNPNFAPSGPSLLAAQGNNNPDSWLEPSSGLVVPNWSFDVFTFGTNNTLNLSGIAGPDFSESGGTPDYIHFTAPPDGASQFAFLSSGSYIDQLVTGFQTGEAYILTFSAESYCPAPVPLTISILSGMNEDVAETETVSPTTAEAYAKYPIRLGNLLRGFHRQQRK